MRQDIPNKKSHGELQPRSQDLRVKVHAADRRRDCVMSVFNEHHSTSILEGAPRRQILIPLSLAMQNTQLGLKSRASIFLRADLFLHGTLLAPCLAASSNRLSSSRHLQYNDDKFEGSKFRNKGETRLQKAQGESMKNKSLQVFSQFKDRC